MDKLIKISSQLMLISFLLMVIIFIIDIFVPLGVAAGVPYMIPVLFSLWYRDRRLTLMIAVLGTILTVLGFFLSPHGGILWMVLSNRLLAIFAIWVTAILILKRKRAEEVLRKLSQAVKQSPVSVVVTDTQGNIEFVNPKFEDVSGYTADELMGKNPSVFKSGKTSPETYKQLWETIKSGREWRGELLNKKKNGYTYWEDAIISSIKDNGGNITHYLGVKEDITERKKTEETLKKSERRYNELFISVMEGIGLVDEYEVIEFCNPAYAKIFEADSAEELIGKCLLEYVPKSQKELLLSRTKDRKKGNSTRYEMEIITMKGNRKIIRASVSPRFDDDNNYIGALGTIMDITETKRLQALQSRAERLETAGEIAGQVAHDFNNLLGPMIAYPDFLRSELPKDHSSLQMLNDIEKAATTMADINQQLLTLSRGGHFEQETLNLNNLVMQNLNQVDAQPDTLNIEMDLAKILMNIKGGTAQLSRIISNLVNNALDAMQSIGHLLIKTENYYVDDVSGAYGRIPKGEYAKLTITDTGCGITNEALPKIFDSFFTTKKTDNRSGSGLGLSVVHTVMKDHNGYIDLQSEFGQGTSFFLYFPITRDELESTDSSTIIGGKESILVIDDDTLQREVSLNLLNRLGYNSIAVNSGEEAIEFIQDNPQDLLVLDMIMPGGIDGTETYKRTLEFNPNQRAIIVSGFAETEQIDLVIKLGAGKFIRKPLTLKSISAAVREELDRVLS